MKYKKEERAMYMMNFAKGLIIGGLIGASISILTNSEIVDPKMRRDMVRSGRKIYRRSRHVFSDAMHMFR